MIEIIQEKLDSYHAATPVEEEQATKEIMQEIALYGNCRTRLTVSSGKRLRLMWRRS